MFVVIIPVTVKLLVISKFLTLECPVVTSKFLPAIETLLVPLTVKLPATTWLPATQLLEPTNKSVDTVATPTTSSFTYALVLPIPKLPS